MVEKSIDPLPPSPSPQNRTAAELMQAIAGYSPQSPSSLMPAPLHSPLTFHQVGNFKIICKVAF